MAGADPEARNRLFDRGLGRRFDFRRIWGILLGYRASPREPIWSVWTRQPRGDLAQRGRGEHTSRAAFRLGAAGRRFSSRVRPGAAAYGVHENRLLRTKAFKPPWPTPMGSRCARLDDRGLFFCVDTPPPPRYHNRILDNWQCTRSPEPDGGKQHDFCRIP